MKLFLSAVFVLAQASDSRQLHASHPNVVGVKQIIAHRGASAVTPECTLVSVRRAICDRATVVEVDVRLTRDGYLVCLHDSTVDRTTNGKGKIGELSLADVRKLDAGSWFDARYQGEKVPTVREVLELCRGRILVLLDLKEDGEEFIRQIAEEVSSFGRENETMFGVRSIEQAHLFRKLLPGAIQIGLIPDTNSIKAFADAKVDYIRLWSRSVLLDRTLPLQVHSRGVKLHMNGKTGEKAEALRLLEYKPDSISSDDPGQLVATLRDLRH